MFPISSDLCMCFSSFLAFGPVLLSVTENSKKMWGWWHNIICHEIFVETLIAGTEKWVEIPKSSVCQPWVLVAQESTVWGGGWSLNPIVPQPQPGSSTVGSWALVEPGCLPVCSGLFLKHSSDVQRRKQLKLKAFPTINEKKKKKSIILLSSSESAV